MTDERNGQGIRRTLRANEIRTTADLQLLDPRDREQLAKTFVDALLLARVQAALNDALDQQAERVRQAIQAIAENERVLAERLADVERAIAALNASRMSTRRAGDDVQALYRVLKRAEPDPATPTPEGD